MLSFRTLLAGIRPTLERGLLARVPAIGIGIFLSGRGHVAPVTVVASEPHQPSGAKIPLLLRELLPAAESILRSKTIKDPLCPLRPRQIGRESSRCMRECF